jgi:hypothetical protein
MQRHCPKLITNYKLRTDGTGNAATLSPINYKLRITNYELTGRAMQRHCPQLITNYKLRTDGTGNAATLSRQGQNVGRKQHQAQTTVPSGTECVCFSANISFVCEQILKPRSCLTGSPESDCRTAPNPTVGLPRIRLSDCLESECRTASNPTVGLPRIRLSDCPESECRIVNRRLKKQRRY